MSDLPIIKRDKEKLLSELAELKIKQSYSRSSLVKYTMENYPVGERQAYNIVKEMNKKLGDVFNEMVGDAFTDSMLFLENLRQEAIKRGDIKLSLDIQKEINKINQLYVDKKEVTIKGEQPLFKEEEDV